MGQAKFNVGSDWAKHLKPFGKRQFWRKVRRESKDVAKGILFMFFNREDFSAECNVLDCELCDGIAIDGGVCQHKCRKHRDEMIEIDMQILPMAA